MNLGGEGNSTDLGLKLIKGKNFGVVLIFFVVRTSFFWLAWDETRIWGLVAGELKFLVTRHTQKSTPKWSVGLGRTCTTVP